MPDIHAIANSIGSGIREFGAHSAKAAAKANGISAGAQAAQGAFNQASANNANAIGTDRLAQQYAFNSGQSAIANAFTQNMWDQSVAYNDAAWERAAEWNEMMLQKQMDFNHAEAKLNRDWQEKMSNTSYQRAMADMEKAGINPILASGGMNAAVGSGSAASIGGTSMSPSSISPMSGQGASGGLLQGNQASEGNYSGQMEYMSGMLGLLSAAIAGISNAQSALGGLGEFGESLGNALGKIFTIGQEDNNKEPKSISDALGIKPTGGGIYGWIENQRQKKAHSGSSGDWGGSHGKW